MNPRATDKWGFGHAWLLAARRLHQAGRERRTLLVRASIPVQGSAGIRIGALVLGFLCLEGLPR